MEQFWFPPIRLIAPPVLCRSFSPFRGTDPDAAPIQRNGASFTFYILSGKSHFGLLCTASFIGKVVGQSTQSLYVNCSAALFKNEYGFFE